MSRTIRKHERRHIQGNVCQQCFRTKNCNCPTFNATDYLDQELPYSISDEADLALVTPVPEGYTEVLINEEYGYRYWRFLFRGTRVELENWWKSLCSVGSFFFNPAFAIESFSLGLVEDITNSGHPLEQNPKIYIHLHEEDDSYLIFSDEMNRGVVHAGYWLDKFENHCDPCSECSPECKVARELGKAHGWVEQSCYSRC